MQSKRKKISIILVCWILISGSVCLANADCIVDFSPCFCTEEPDLGQRVICYQVLFEDIKNAFEANTDIRKLNRLDVLPALTENDPIPPDLLGSFQVRSIYVATCNVQIEIDENAFLSSIDYMEEFRFIDCDIDKLTWSFLNRFTKLERLQLEFAENIQSLSSLPPVPSVKLLSIISSKGFDSLATNFPGSSLSGLQSLILKDNEELDDPKIDSILSIGLGRLESLSVINSPSISKVPEKVAGLVSLNSIELSQCVIKSITSDSLAFSARPVLSVNLKKVSLSSISDDAFEKGFYGEAKVMLDENELTDFKSTVYLKLLNDMQSSAVPGGLVSIEKNSIKCDDCELAWLIRDFPELLVFVSGTCSNSTRFEDLNPSWYDEKLCPSIIPTTIPSTTTEEMETTTVTELTTVDPETTTVTTEEMETTTVTELTTIDPETTTVTELTTTIDPETTTGAELTTNVDTETTTVVTEDVTLTTTSDSSNTASDSTKTTDEPTNNPTITSGSPTSSSSTKTTSSSTTAESPIKEPEKSYDTLFYVLIGILSLIALVLICGFIYLCCFYKKARRKTRNLEMDSLPSYDRMSAPSPPPVPVDFGQYGKVLTRGEPMVIAPYMHNPPPSNRPPGRVRGLRRIQF